MLPKDEWYNETYVVCFLRKQKAAEIYKERMIAYQ
jgi:hypothetical protein